MNFKNISAWSIRNPIPPLVMFFGLTVAGIVSFLMMGVQSDPDIDFPGAIVIIAQPGAAPTELETQVTQRVEAAVRTIEGIDELNSTVTEGQSQTFVQFAIGTPIDRAVTDIRDKITQIRSNLPNGILEPQVIRLSTSGNTLAYWSASATDMTLEELSWYVDNVVAKRLIAVPGMGDAYRRGGVSREIRVILNPERMRAYGLTAAAVNTQLVQLNVNAAGGRMEVAGSEQAVRILGNASSANALGETLISVGTNRTVRLADIAEVKDLYAEQRSVSKQDGRQVLTFGFERAKGASDVTVYDAAVEELRKLEKENPKVKFTELFSDIEYTDQRDGRGRDSRGRRRLPLPARLARHLDLGARDPALGGPDLPLHGPDGLLAQHDDAARAQPRCRRAGRRRDRRDREYRAPHADGQIGLSGFD
jgi:multidrug efflux pump subunit AcrB